MRLAHANITAIAIATVLLGAPSAAPAAADDGAASDRAAMIDAPPPSDGAHGWQAVKDFAAAAAIDLLRALFYVGKALAIPVLALLWLIAHVPAAIVGAAVIACAIAGTMAGLEASRARGRTPWWHAPYALGGLAAGIAGGLTMFALPVAVARTVGFLDQPLAAVVARTWRIWGWS